MELDNWKTLLNTCKTYDEFFEFIKKNTQKIKQQNLLYSDHNVRSFYVSTHNFILKPNFVIEKKEVILQQSQAQSQAQPQPQPKKEVKKRDTIDSFGLYLYEKNIEKLYFILFI